MLGPRPNPGGTKPPGGAVRGQLGVYSAPPVPKRGLLVRTGQREQRSSGEGSAVFGAGAMRALQRTGRGARGPGNERSATDRARKGYGGETGAKERGSRAMSAPQRKGRTRRRGWGRWWQHAQSPARTEPQGCRCSAPAPQWRRDGAAGPSLELCPRWVLGRERRCCWGPGVAVRHWAQATLGTGGLGSVAFTGDNGAVGPWRLKATGVARIAASEVKIRQK